MSPPNATSNIPPSIVGTHLYDISVAFLFGEARDILGRRHHLSEINAVRKIIN